MIQVVRIAYADVPEAWEIAAPFIERAIERGSGEYILEDMAYMCGAGAWHLWLMGRDGKPVAAAITSIADYPRTRIVYIQAFGGELDKEVCAQAWNVLLDFARKNGCSRVQFMGRPGWSRSGVLPEGWRKTHEVVTVPVWVAEAELPLAQTSPQGG